MADTSDIRVGLQAFLQKKSATTVKSTLVDKAPTFEFFLALSGDKNGADGIGRPKSELMLSALQGVSSAQRAKIFAEREYRPLVQTTKPDVSEVKAMSDYDNDPTVPNWDTTNRTLERFTQPVFKFARKKIPYKVAHSAVRTAKSGSGAVEAQAASAIRSVYEVEVKTRNATLCEKINNELFGINSEQGYPTDETAVTWDHIHSFASALKEDNTYGGVDRSLSKNAFWRGNYLSTTFNGTFEDFINYLNYDKGMIRKGLGVQMIAVGGNLMKKAKAEARANGYQLLTNGIPEFPEYGFKREVVRIYSGNRPVYVYYDPAVPSVMRGDATNHAIALDPSTWTIAIHPDSNFTVSKPADQTENEGGDEADTGTIATELLMCCEVPSGNAYHTDFAA